PGGQLEPGIQRDRRIHLQGSRVRGGHHLQLRGAKRELPPPLGPGGREPTGEKVRGRRASRGRGFSNRRHRLAAEAEEEALKTSLFTSSLFFRSGRRSGSGRFGGRRGGSGSARDPDGFGRAGQLLFAVGNHLVIIVVFDIEARLLAVPVDGDRGDGFSLGSKGVSHQTA